MHASRLVESLVVLVLLIPVSTFAADLNNATEQLRSWQKKIVSIRVRSRVSSIAASDAMLREANVKTSLGVKDWIWEDSGRYRSEKICYNDDKLAIREMDLADFKRTYHMGYPADDAGREIPATVTIRENVHSRGGNGLIDPPLWILWDGTWLGERLIKVAASETNADGLLQFDGTAIGADKCVVMLDPQHGFLPKRAQNDYCLFSVEEFREIEPGFWFPWKGTLTINDNILQSWELTQVDLNAELPASLFVPLMGDETYISDILTGKQYWHGGKPPASLLAKKMALENSERELVKTSQISMTGEPERPVSWSIWFMLIGVACVLGGIWARRRA